MTLVMIPRVRQVIAASTAAGFDIPLTGQFIPQTPAPTRSATAFAVEVKVKLGMITLSPGARFSVRHAISSAWVQES